MYEYKNGFTLIEVLLVIVMLIGMFSMSLSILNSFSSSNQKYLEDDFANIKLVLNQIKYLQMAGEENIVINCDSKRISLLLDDQIIEEKPLKNLTCEAQALSLKLSNASSTFEVNVNKYGYAAFQRI